MGATEREAHLAELRDAAGYRDLVERMITTAAIAARLEGATWADIGTALGISHQGARKRFMDHPALAQALVVQVNA